MTTSEPKKKLRGAAAWFIQHFGAPIRDHRNQELLGRALVCTFRGKVFLIGFTGETPVKPVFLADPSVRYWRQTIRFEAAEVPDFERAN